MLQWALIFLLVAIIAAAAAVGFLGINGIATNSAWILSVISLLVAGIFYFTDRELKIPYH
jgi:uncharacterized membrane protein YtjA (UPF0391 family)